MESLYAHYMHLLTNNTERLSVNRSMLLLCNHTRLIEDMLASSLWLLWVVPLFALQPYNRYIIYNLSSFNSYGGQLIGLVNDPNLDRYLDRDSIVRILSMRTK